MSAASSSMAAVVPGYEISSQKPSSFRKEANTPWRSLPEGGIRGQQLLRCRWWENGPGMRQRIHRRRCMRIDRIDDDANSRRRIDGWELDVGRTRADGKSVFC
jgi:hypothetical protein